MGTFTYDSNAFYLNGEPFRVLSGSIHYFRTVPDYWRDRLRKLKQCGFNTVETYTCWNLHERTEGKFDFSGILDIGRFLDIAREEGLAAIVRPGPYICAEWDFGGLPSWLLKYENIRIRCNDERFVKLEKTYLDALFGVLRPRLVTNGGNIIMMQVENEYGSYGNDKEYLSALAAYYIESGINVPLFTSDASSDIYYGGGSCPMLLATCNFGSDWKTHFDNLKKHRPNQPVMCTEFWEGWFDSWYEPHHRREPDDVARLLDEMLAIGSNVNFYMFVGGTNFGFFNGANAYEKYAPQTTSYDYDAIITEAGDLTKRYYEVRAVAEKHFGKLPELTVCNTEKKAYGAVTLKECAALFENLFAISAPVKSAYPLTMEELGADFGFVLYSTEVNYSINDVPLVIEPLRDRAIVFINGVFAGIKERDRRNDDIRITVAEGETVRIDILVENMGRVNYGEYISCEKKGLVGGARLDRQFMFGWTMYPLTMDDLSKLCFAPLADKTEYPAFLRGELEINGQPEDTFVRLEGFHKGFVKINGFNLGRYWNDAGPQKTLYVPAPVLKTGKNEIVVCELSSCDNPCITFTDTHDLG